MSTVISEAGPNIKSDQQPIHGREVEPQLINRARKLFEIDSSDASSYPTTFLGLAYLEARMRARSFEFTDKAEPTELELLSDAIAGVYETISIIEKVSTGGVDILTDRFGADDIADNLSDVMKEARQFFKNEEDWLQQYPNVTDDTPEQREDLANAILRIEEAEVGLAHAIDAMTLVHLLSGSKSMAKGVAGIARMQNRRDIVGGPKVSDDPDEGFIDLTTKSLRAANYLNESAVRNPSAMRRDTLRQIKAVIGGQFDALMNEETPEPSSTELDVAKLPDKGVGFEFLQGQELNFQILPGDTNLRTLSEEIFAESTDVEKVRVDLGRVQILEDIRQLFGKDKCYFARGIRSGVTYANDKNERIDEDFIVLVMQNHDSFGSVVSEDALAISPISRRHAAFYMRQDASAGLSWREVFSLTKKDAKSFGARKLKFVSTENLDPYDAMREKIFTLAAGSADDFEDELRYDVANKQYVLRKARIRANMAASAVSRSEL